MVEVLGGDNDAGPGKHREGADLFLVDSAEDHSIEDFVEYGTRSHAWCGEDQARDVAL